MSAATVSLTRKINGGNDLLSIGGTDASDFEANLVAVLGREGASSVLAEAAQAFAPVSAGGPPPQQYQPQTQQQAAQVVQAQFPQAQPVQQPQQAAAQSAPVCASHGQPAVWRQKKDNSGGFFKCPVNDSIISEFNDSSRIKNFCPAPKQR